MFKKLVNKIRKSIKEWLLGNEIKVMQNIINSQDEVISKQNGLLKNFGVGADIHISDHKYSRSWAVICLQGQKADFIKFVDLGDRDIREIGNYLKHFDRKHVNMDLPHGMPKNIFLRF